MKGLVVGIIEECLSGSRRSDSDVTVTGKKVGIHERETVSKQGSRGEVGIIALIKILVFFGDKEDKVKNDVAEVGEDVEGDDRAILSLDVLFDVHATKKVIVNFRLWGSIRKVFRFGVRARNFSKTGVLGNGESASLERWSHSEDVSVRMCRRGDL
jgi:hypothetical protein